MTLLNLIVNGETYDLKAGNVSNVILREIQMKEARQLETMQIPGQTGITVSNDKWHSDLIDSW